ncbi:acetyl-coenzyme A carboxylase carboxyl transferase subunit alpha [Halomonas elongata]|uniref:acetyl-CoA carboxytransferase n=1 Tax=Halomonas elongata TaxID=2746 RepID=A0A1B8NX06_HALEL|nr:acetyl-coenzyme A carboxylase carboxyl transferase subunit alpha [Halomonas elongata]
MNPNYLDFEQPIAELQAKIEELRMVGNDSQVNLSDEIGRLEEKSRKLTESIFKDLSAWQVSQLSRHPQRPYTLDYLEHVFTDFDELHGDRRFADDAAIVGVWLAWTTSRSWSSAIRKAATCTRRYAATSACRAQRVTARHAG